MARSDTASTEPRDLGEVLDFLRLLWAIEHLLKSTSKRMQRRLGVTGPQRLVLRVVEQYPDMSAGELAAILHLHPSTVTGIVERLVQRRLLVRSRDKVDQRRVQLRPTSRGPRGLRGPTVETAVKRVLDRAKPGDVRAARRVLETLVSALDDHAAGEVRAAAWKTTSKRARRS